jgi:hypothetical protein
MKRRLLVIAALAVVVVLSTWGARVAIDERRLSSIAVGMNLSEVEKSLGHPTEVFRAPLPPVYAPRHCEPKDKITAAVLYSRGWRDSLFVFVDKESRVLCTERVSISYGVHVMEGR